MLPTHVSARDRWLLKELPKGTKSRLPKLTKSKIRLLETAKFLSPLEEGRLLELLLHVRFTTEISTANRAQKITLLEKLGLAYFTHTHRHRRYGLLRWLQVSSNERMSQFIKKHARNMSPLEAGLLYGYPPTAILAFIRLIPRHTKQSRHDPLDYFFGMVRSRDWLKEERRHYRTLLKKIKTLSPKIYREMMAAHKERRSLLLRSNR